MLFGIVHDYMGPWARRFFLTSSGDNIKHIDLVKTIWDRVIKRTPPLALVKVKAHTGENTYIAKNKLTQERKLLLHSLCRFLLRLRFLQKQSTLMSLKPKLNSTHRHKSTCLLSKAVIWMARVCGDTRTLW